MRGPLSSLRQAFFASGFLERSKLSWSHSTGSTFGAKVSAVGPPWALPREVMDNVAARIGGVPHGRGGRNSGRVVATMNSTSAGTKNGASRIKIRRPANFRNSH
jgi:hypothetical protein